MPDRRYNKHSILLVWSSRCSELSWAFLYITSLVESHRRCSCFQVEGMSSGSVCQLFSRGEVWLCRMGPGCCPRPTNPFSEAPGSCSCSSGPWLASVTTFCVWWGNSLKQCGSAGAVLGKRTYTALCASGKKGRRCCLGVLGLFACASLGLKGTLRKSAGVFLCCFVFFNKLIRGVWGR